MEKEKYIFTNIVEVGKNEVFKYFPILDTISKLGNYKELINPNELQLLEFEIEQRLSKVSEDTLKVPSGVRLKTIFDDLILSVTDKQLKALYIEMLAIEFTNEQEKNSLYLNCLKYLSVTDIKTLKKYFSVLYQYEEVGSLPMLRTISNTEHISVLLIDDCSEEECIEVSYSFEKLKSLNLLFESRIDHKTEKDLQLMKKILKNKDYINAKSYALYMVTLSQIGYSFMKFVDIELEGEV